MSGTRAQWIRRSLIATALGASVVAAFALAWPRAHVHVAGETDVVESVATPKTTTASGSEPFEHLYDQLGEAKQ